MREANTFDISLLIFLAVIWGSSFFNIKIASYSYDPFTLALIRVIFASIPLVLLCKIKSIRIEAFSKDWKSYSLIGLCNIAIPFTLIALGTSKINSYLAAMLMSTTPLSGSILAHFFTKKMHSNNHTATRTTQANTAKQSFISYNAIVLPCLFDYSLAQQVPTAHPHYGFSQHAQCFR